MFKLEILWNNVNLARPPYRSWDISLIEYDPRNFIETLEMILIDFQSFAIFNKEAALLSRLIYRMKSKFRHDKGFKYMEKINRALLNYLSMSLEKEYKDLKKYTELNNGITTLPSKQTIEYILVRTQGLAKLMCCIDSTAMKAGNILKSRIHTGQFWSVAMIAYSVISRIWYMSRHIIKCLCLWYNNIYSSTKTFKTIGVAWLPDNYVLPQNLSKWLNLPWLTGDIKILPSKEKWEKSIFNLIEVNNEVQSDLNNINTRDNEISNSLKKKIISKNNDLGKPISRTNFEKLNFKSCNKDTKKRKNMTKIKKITEKSELLDIKTEKDLVNLLKTDSFPGLDKLQWNMLRNRLKKFLNKLINNNKVDIDEKLFKKVRKKIFKMVNIA